MSENANELESFKRRVDLVRYAAGSGFRIDHRKSWKGTTALRNGGEIIFVKRRENGQQVYWSATSNGDSGSIIDFVQRRKNMNLGEVRKELRPWL